MPLLPTPWPADPVEGEPGHFDHTLWVKAGLIALDNGKIDKPAASVPAGKLLATTATDTWGAVDPTAVGGVPSGVIVMWSGTTAPSGWALCNGTNGTPDLRNKFILGWGTRASGSTGGEESVTLTSAQSGVPAHTHTSEDANANHSHTIAQRHFLHSHSASSGPATPEPLGLLAWDQQNYYKGDGSYTAVRAITQRGGAHTHPISIGNVWDVPWNWTFPVDAADAKHKHTINANTAADAGQAHNNMPPYYVLAFIMKL